MWEGVGGVVVGTALYVSPEMMDTTHRTHYNQVCVCGKGWGGVVVGTALYVSPEMMDPTHRTHYNQVCVGGGGVGGGNSSVCESRDDGYNSQDTLQSGLCGGGVGTALYVSPEMMDTTHRTHYYQVCVGGGGGGNSTVCESRDDGYNSQDTLQSGLCGGVGGGNSSVCESRDDGYNSQDTLQSGLCGGGGWEQHCM